jgi:hypothetical protein
MLILEHFFNDCKISEVLQKEYNVRTLRYAVFSRA